MACLLFMASDVILLTMLGLVYFSITFMHESPASDTTWIVTNVNFNKLGKKNSTKELNSSPRLVARIDNVMHASLTTDERKSPI